MKKYLFTLVFIACFFIENQVYADYFVPPPYTVPYTVNGHTYDQIIQQIWTGDLANDHKWQQVHYCNSHYFNVAKPILSAIDNSHNTFAPRIFTMDWLHMYNSDTDAFDYDLVMGNSSSDNQEFCIVYYTADGGSHWTENTLTSLIPSVDLYGDFKYTDYIRSTFDLYWSSQPFTPSNSYYNNQFQDGLNRKTNRLIIPASSFGGQVASTPLRFPFAAPATAYTAPVSSVMDQSTLGQGVPFPKGEDRKVKTFEGEVGDVGPYNGGVNGNTCYRKFGNASNAAFGISFNYIGTTKTGGRNYLCYDAHPAYDFPAPANTDVKIFAPANGILCAASTYTTKQNPLNIWRNPTQCPLPSVVTSKWLDPKINPKNKGYNTFYIIHKDLRINGSTNDYMTVFLHNNALSPEARTKIEQFGYVKVSAGNFIALVGGYGPNGPNTFPKHMHFEAYKKNGAKWDRVDPYGNGTQNILWERK